MHMVYLEWWESGSNSSYRKSNRERERQIEFVSVRGERERERGWEAAAT